MADERRVFLSTLPAGRGERRLAVVLVSAVIFITAAPFAKVRLAPPGPHLARPPSPRRPWQGARGYLTKPFDIAELLALFDTMLAD